MPATQDRNEQRRARALAKRDGISYNAALLRLRDQQVDDLRASGQSVGRVFNESGFDVVDVFRREIKVDITGLTLVIYEAALERARREGLGLLLRAFRLADQTAPDFARGRAYAERATAAVFKQLDEPDFYGRPPEPEDVAAAYYAMPSLEFAQVVHEWLAADHPARLATLANITWRSEPSDLPGPGAVQSLLGDLDDVATAQLLDAEALDAVRKALVDRLIMEPNR